MSAWDSFADISEFTDIADWEAFEAWLSKIPADRRLVFRGQQNYDWLLATSLERFALSVHVGAAANVRADFDQISTRQPWIEERLVSEFKRAAHHYNVEPLSDEDAFGWLALMQHFGAPTRLLDWTESPYVALYFAVESADTRYSPAVFAVDLDALDLALSERWNTNTSAELLSAMSCLDGFAGQPGTPETRTGSLNEYLLRHGDSGLTGVVAARPFKMNQRLALQKGLFLVPLSLNHSFMAQLVTVIRSCAHDPILYRARLTSLNRSAILKKLDSMNLHPASLVPSLEGYARSLKMRYEITKLRDLV